jgi:ribosomal protein S18 acetylase RimI-like enzyme
VFDRLLSLKLDHFWVVSFSSRSHGDYQEMEIRIVPNNLAPLDLLLSADPSIKRVRESLQHGIVFIGEEDGAVVAVAVLGLESSVAELKNIAVVEYRRRSGLGRQILAHVLNYAAQAGIGRVTVGTGNSSLPQLAFYQKSGFRVIGVIAGYFDDYQPPIFEDGIPCRDMIRLAIDLQKANQTPESIAAADRGSS